MSVTPSFLAELIRAANGVERLSNVKKRQLLEQAVTAIRRMRDDIGIQQSRTAADTVIDLQATAIALTVGKRSDEQVKKALLHAAEMIRALKIILDAKAGTGLK